MKQATMMFFGISRAMMMRGMAGEKRREGAIKLVHGDFYLKPTFILGIIENEFARKC